MHTHPHALAYTRIHSHIHDTHTQTIRTHAASTRTHTTHTEGVATHTNGKHTACTHSMHTHSHALAYISIHSHTHDTHTRTRYEHTRKAHAASTRDTHSTTPPCGGMCSTPGSRRGPPDAPQASAAPWPSDHAQHNAHAPGAPHALCARSAVGRGGGGVPTTQDVREVWWTKVPDLLAPQGKVRVVVPVNATL